MAYIGLLAGPCPEAQSQIALAAGHRQVDVGQDLGVQQCAVQRAAGVIDVVTLAQRVQAVALTRVQVAGHLQGIQHRAMVAHGIAPTQQRQLVVQETDVERRVVDDQFRPGQELEQFVDDLREARFVREELVADAVDFHRAVIDRPLGIDVLMEMPTARAPVNQFHAADFDDSMTIGGLQAGRLGVEDDLSHRFSKPIRVDPMGPPAIT